MKPAAQKRQPHSQPRLASTRYMSPNTDSRVSTGVGVEAVEVRDETSLDAPAARAPVREGDQVTGGVVLGGVAVGPVGAAHLLAALEDALAIRGPGRRAGKELAQHLLRLADQEEVDELGERLGVEKGGRAAGEDERPVRAPLPAPERDAGQRQAVEHVHVVRLEGERERDHVEVAKRAVLLEGAQGARPLGARAVGEEGAVGGDARVLRQDAEHGLEPQVRHADCVGVRIDEADGEWAARAGAKQTSLGGATIGRMGHRRPDLIPRTSTGLNPARGSWAAPGAWPSRHGAKPRTPKRGGSACPRSPTSARSEGSARRRGFAGAALMAIIRD